MTLLAALAVVLGVFQSSIRHGGGGLVRAERVRKSWSSFSDKEKGIECQHSPCSHADDLADGCRLTTDFCCTHLCGYARAVFGGAAERDGEWVALQVCGDPFGAAHVRPRTRELWVPPMAPQVSARVREHAASPRRAIQRRHAAVLELFPRPRQAFVPKCGLQQLGDVLQVLVRYGWQHPECAMEEACCGACLGRWHLRRERSHQVRL